MAFAAMSLGCRVRVPLNLINVMPSENQHWGPKFLIKNFADTDGRVFRLDIQTDEITKPPPKYAASDAGFNEFIVEGETVSFEDRLEKIETQAAPILKRINNTRSFVGLTQQERVRISDFMAAQSFRTEAFYKGQSHQPPRQEFGAAFSELWRSSFVISGEIARRHWALMVIESDDAFYLGDNPVVLQRTENPKDGSGLGFDVEGVEAFLPLSPHCALYLPCRSTSEQIITGYENALAVHRAVRSAALRGVPGGSNELELSQRVIRQSHDLYQSLTTGSALTAIAPYVENLNYLQCAWAHSAIYSHRKDFTFAGRVFRENPQYRSVPKTMLQEIMVRVPVDVPEA
jgi:hypothetical protein